MIRRAVHEVYYYGFTVFCKHIKAIIKKDEMPYVIAKHKRADDFTLKTIERLVSYNFYINKGKRLNLKQPETFDEKINWSMIYDATSIKTRLVDKFLVRDYVKEKVGEKYLVPLLGAWNCFDDIDFSKLPQKFALKLNNGSGMNIIVKNKDNLDLNAAKKKFDSWMQTNFAYRNFELQYRDVPQKILAEKYIEQHDGNLYDYKFHFYNGRMYVCQVIGDRDLDHHIAYQAFFDADWNRVNESEGSYPDYKETPAKPNNWEEMKQIAEKLAEDFNYVRIDLYSVNNTIYFSEYTFTPAAGHHPNFAPDSVDEKWGKNFMLPKKYMLELPKKKIRIKQN